MTEEALTELNRKIAVMEAYRDGREIEYRRYAYQIDWRDSADPSPAWNWAEFDYRVKPEPPIALTLLRSATGEYHGGSWCFKNRKESEIRFLELTPEVRVKLNL